MEKHNNKNIAKALSKVTAAVRRVVAFCVRHAGLNLVYLGVMLYAVFYLTGLTNYNILLYIPLLLIIIGTMGFVRHKKTEEKY